MGMVALLSGGSISWASIHGKTVATSTCEAEIDAAMAALNQAWEAASGEMYKATQEGAAGGEGAPNNNPGGNGGDEVTDVDFEEVK